VSDLVDPKEIQSSFAPAFGYEGLSLLLGRGPSTLMADRCRRPWSLPPACPIPGNKSPVWLLKDVLEWIESYREQPAKLPDVLPKRVHKTASPLTGRKRGRPTKREELARKQAALEQAQSNP
jgi:hypothetical protein